MMKNVSFCISGMDYVIQTDEAPEYIKGLAAEVERKISVYLRMGSKVTLTMSAVLAAMECCDESEKFKSDVENLRRQITSYIQEAADARDEADKLRIEASSGSDSKTASLMDENRQLREQIGKLVEQISRDSSYLGSDSGDLESENRRLCEELEKANAFIEEASRAINEKEELMRRLDSTTEELERYKQENRELEELIEEYDK